jgi:hypothetical protein
MKKNKFKVYGIGQELTWGEISSKLAKKIIASGLDIALKDDLISESESGIISNIRIEFNKTNIDFDISQIDKKITSKIYSAGNPKKWHLLEVLGLNGLFYETITDKPFDPKKISISKEQFKVGSLLFNSVFYSISYDGQDKSEDFDYAQREYTDAQYYLLSPKSEIYEININDDENEEIDEPEDNFTEDAEKAVLEILCDNLSTAEKLTSELSTWGSLWHDIKIEKISMPNNVLLRIVGSKAILMRVDTVTNQSAIQALGIFSKAILG